MLQDDLVNLLPQNAIDKSRRFHKVADSKAYLTGQILSRKVLSIYNYCNINNIAFTTGRNNKPELSSDFQGAVRYFNISHTTDFLCVALGMAPVGIDVEALKPFDYKLFMQDNYTEKEQAAVIQSENSLHTFYKIWTRKEAVLKMNGIGLIDDLKQIDVSASIGYMAVEALATATPYYITSFYIADQWVGSVCNNAENWQEVLFYDDSVLL